LKKKKVGWAGKKKVLEWWARRWENWSGEESGGLCGGKVEEGRRQRREGD
jgi:hypothetical protein